MASGRAADMCSLSENYLDSGFGPDAAVHHLRGDLKQHSGMCSDGPSYGKPVFFLEGTGLING